MLWLRSPYDEHGCELHDRRNPTARSLFLGILATGACAGLAGAVAAIDIPVSAKVHLIEQDEKAGFVAKLAKIVIKEPTGFDVGAVDLTCCDVAWTQACVDLVGLYCGRCLRFP